MLSALYAEVADDDGFSFDGDLGTVLFVLLIILVVALIVYFIRRA